MPRPHRQAVHTLRAIPLSAEEVRLLTGWPPAVSVVAREELRARLRRRVLRARQRWYHPARRGFHPDDPFL
jgi:predicted DNA-binding transcriptional regulator YafY